jgi:hypothetical protein
VSEGGAGQQLDCSYSMRYARNSHCVLQGTQIAGPLYCNSLFGVLHIFLSFFSRPMIRGGYTISATNQGSIKR